MRHHQFLLGHRVSYVGSRLLLAVAVVGLVAPLGACASRKSRNRMKVIAAERADLMQRNDSLRSQIMGETSEKDRLAAEVQQLQHEKVQFEESLAQSQSQTQEALTRAEQSDIHRADALREAEMALDQAEKLAAEVAERDQALEEAHRLLQANRRVATGPEPSARNGYDYNNDPALAALQRDLRDRLSSEGINMPVEIRTAQDGMRRVAVVLPDAFKAGKATLAYNADAVTAVVRLGQLVQSHYPDSRISIEGHTDSDPIRKSNWRDNQHLSQARAEHVSTLLGNTGIANERLEAIGRGATQPIEQGATSRAKSRNRRVELFIQPR